MIRILAVIALVLLPSVPAVAQQPRLKPYVVVGAAFPLSTEGFDEHQTLRTNAEDGSFDVDYPISGSAGVEIGGGVALWRQLGVRVGWSHFSTNSTATLDASLPHPFFFNRPRTLSTEVSGLERSEDAFGAHAMGVFQIGARLQIAVFAGPTWISVKQDVIESFNYSDTYPYDSVSFTNAATSQSSGTKATFGGGVDVSYFFTKLLGAAGGIQLGQADIEIDTSTGHTQTIKTGGPRAFAGIAFRFP